jgi:hypothetical protein
MFDVVMVGGAAIVWVLLILYYNTV